MFDSSKFDSLNSFLSGRVALNYVNQKVPYEQKIEKLSQVLAQSSFVLIGAGAGMSTAAGAQYGGKFFEENFGEFQRKYGSGMYMRDMYSAGFYPYPSEEAFWGYWSKQALVGGVNLDVTPLHRQLLNLLKDKDVFCLSTNADGQFEKAGLSKDRIFCTQGDYFHIQCARGCHNKIYEATSLFKQMDAVREDCCIPSSLVPKCPVCGGMMNMNLRCDSYFVEDESWHAAESNFVTWLNNALCEASSSSENSSAGKICLLELGVGFNTPTIIRWPFERLATQYDDVTLVRLNWEDASVPAVLEPKAVGIQGDIANVVHDLEVLTTAKEE